MEMIVVGTKGPGQQHALVYHFPDAYPGKGRAEVDRGPGRLESYSCLWLASGVWAQAVDQDRQFEIALRVALVLGQAAYSSISGSSEYWVKC